MKKRILVKAPAMSRSGYGEQSRFALRALKSREELFDIYLINLSWGHTGMMADYGPERQWLDELILKTTHYVQECQQQQVPPQFDLSLQITIPNEFEQIAPVNIGYTAGIETNKCAPQWIEKINGIVDKVITISTHSKKVFENTKYDFPEMRDPVTGEPLINWGVTKPVEVVNYAVKEVLPDPEGLDIPFETTKNFLCVSQWGPRKNLENTIRWFLDEFHEDEDVGLVLKTNTANESILDREHTSRRLKTLIHDFPDRKCKIYLVHGQISEEQLTWLYQHPSMQALINIGHGEGFGLPLFEAAYNGLPLVTVSWSGQMDFICAPNKKGKMVPRVARVDYDIKPVQPEAHWEGVVQADSMWSFAKKASYKRAIRDVVNKKIYYRNQAKSLQKYILQNFKEEDAYSKFVGCLVNEEEFDVENWLDDLDLEVHD
tara:strand:+ start:3131 stop:4423 length:1293 start_codon:yes stop_codon:yes gene_type:complete